MNHKDTKAESTRMEFRRSKANHSFRPLVHLVFRGSCLLCVFVSLWLVLVKTALAADVESRQLTHYVPQDFLESAVRTENWTEVLLNVKGGVRKGDTVRIWAGGLIDRGGGDQPGQNVNGPVGHVAEVGNDKRTFALSVEPAHAYALLFKTESAPAAKCLPPGQPLEIKLTKDNEKLWVGFNDEKGQYRDNHLGRGRRHELDPLWVRIEVVRITVD
jgi:hypothetical protein